MPLFFWPTYAFLFGLCFGSFANVLIRRLPRGLPVITPPSACPECGQRLRAWDLVPVLSWLVLRGRCRYCNGPVSVRYPAVELLCGLLFAGMALLTPTLSAIPLALFAFVLLCVSAIDIDTREIPDGLLVFGGVVGVLWVALGRFAPAAFPLVPGIAGAALGALAGGLTLFLVDMLVLLLAKKYGFGFGDVKLMAMAGLFLGWQLVAVAFVFAFVSGGAFAAFLLLTRRAKRGDYLAFGPFLAVGCLCALWWGRAFIGLLA